MLHKNKGNVKLTKALNKLIKDITEANWANQKELQNTRPDADCVHPDGFYFFDINIHRSMVLIEFIEEVNEEGIANILWAGNHDEYERIFGNNKKVIEKWLRSQGLVD